jgi:chromosome segregation protein
LERARAEVESRATALGVDLSNVSQVPAARIKSRDEAQVQLDEIRNQLNGIGDVRVSAIDEYNRVSDRLNSLKSDQEDLALSRGDLEQLMAHIESVMAERFTETFARICAVFTGVFAEMFPGGEGRLVCLNPDRPLESGIEVELTLPGKRAQSINLLSGGERAMTAIALLLSVLTTKPTPFCLLDEIDAALDDQNIDRYIAILKRLTRDTQFVMITHSKETMVSADRLYGVTMQESGVSQILSVVMQNAAATTETGVEQ